MNYAVIKKTDVANGPGVRVSLFVSGCTHYCKGCFNSEAWDFAYGQPFTGDTAEEILDALAPSYIRGFSVLGGEPLEPANRDTVWELLQKVKETYPEKTIWLYTGSLFEEIRDLPFVPMIDVIVDGPYVEALRDTQLHWKGSRNQRVIDVKRTLAAGRIVLWD